MLCQTSRCHKTLES
uniref:Uncharacterized protein n=1 Tax=Medicago truncatula TaxID=3880 RepID=I3S9H0_MEDTR|nr:unknown [Medicago truncatula]